MASVLTLLVLHTSASAASPAAICGDQKIIKAHSAQLGTAVEGAGDEKVVMLIVKLKNGRTADFSAGNPDEGSASSCVTGYLPSLDSLLIEHRGSEDIDYSLVRLTDGYVLNIPGTPILSPDRKKMMIFDAGWNAHPDSSDSFFQILDVRDKTYKKEFSMPHPQQGDPAGFRWVSDNAIEYQDPAPNDPDTLQRACLMFQKSKWLKTDCPPK